MIKTIKWQSRGCSIFKKKTLSGFHRGETNLFFPKMISNKSENLRQTKWKRIDFATPKSFDNVPDPSAEMWWTLDILMMEGIGYVRVGFSEEPFPSYVLFLFSGWLKGGNFSRIFLILKTHNNPSSALFGTKSMFQVCSQFKFSAAVAKNLKFRTEYWKHPILTCIADLLGGCFPTPSKSGRRRRKVGKFTNNAVEGTKLSIRGMYAVIFNCKIS